MRIPTHADAFEVLLLQAADEGRGPVLFGDCLERARKAARPFMQGKQMPDVYLEYPLLGDPFLDLTILYGNMDPNTRVDSPIAEGTDDMLSWFAEERDRDVSICCGFELDTKHAELPVAAIHFQPRSRIELVAPFCEKVGEPERAELYHELANRLPESWQPSFFGMFRGRPGSPLRVCGYLSEEEKEQCLDPRHLAHVFDQAGFEAYDEHMLDQAVKLVAATPGSIDYQFDIYPDRTLGTTFAFDAQFAIQQPEAVISSFENGPAAPVMKLLEEWGIADSRWKLGVQSAFARALPVKHPDGKPDRFGFTLMPQWVKVRWTDGVLQPSKLYNLGNAKLLGD